MHTQPKTINKIEIKQHVGCREDGHVPMICCIFLFRSWGNCIGWLCFKCRCMFVVLASLVSTVLQQMQHTSSHRLSGSPRSFGLNPKCSHAAAVAFGFETNFIFVFYSSKSQLVFSLACYSSRGAHAALWKRMSRKTRGRQGMWKGSDSPVTPGLRLPTQRPCGWQVTHDWRVNSSLR